MPIVRDLIQTVVIGKTLGHQPASLQVHGLIAAIFAQMDVMDLMEQQFVAAAQNVSLRRGPPCGFWRYRDFALLRVNLRAHEELWHRPFC